MEAKDLTTHKFTYEEVEYWRNIYIKTWIHVSAPAPNARANTLLRVWQLVYDKWAQHEA